ncbi:MAG: hypothetical protein AB7L92_06365 [Alphaproteobacteria bacterium]
MSDPKRLEDMAPEEREAELKKIKERAARAAEEIQMEHHGTGHSVFADPDEILKREREAASALESARASGAVSAKSPIAREEEVRITAAVRAELARERGHPLRGLGTTSGSWEEKTKDKGDRARG